MKAFKTWNRFPLYILKKVSRRTQTNPPPKKKKLFEEINPFDQSIFGSSNQTLVFNFRTHYLLKSTTIYKSITTVITRKL